MAIAGSDPGLINPVWCRFGGHMTIVLLLVQVAAVSQDQVLNIRMFLQQSGDPL